MGDVAGPGCNEGDSTGSDARTGGDVHRLERAKGKLDITTSDKTNKMPILVSY